MTQMGSEKSSKFRSENIGLRNRLPSPEFSTFPLNQVPPPVVYTVLITCGSLNCEDFRNA